MEFVLYFMTLWISHKAVTSASAESTPSPKPQITMVYDIFQSQTWGNRLFSINTTSPVARDIRSHPDSDALIQPAFDYIDKIWEVVKKRRDNNDFRACNLYEIQDKRNQQDWPTAWLQRAQFYQLGLINRSCYSSIDVTRACEEGELPPNMSTEAPKVFVNANIGFSEAFTRLKIVPDGNWSKDGTSYNMTSRNRRREDQNCLISSLLAHRKKNVWYLRGQVTNKVLDIHAQAYRRHFLFEHVPRRGEKSMEITFPNRKTGIIERGTTVMSTWHGYGYSIEIDLFDDPTGPLYKAYQNNVLSVDLASDAITLSNIAILALPMIMNLIPAAFLAEIHAIGILMYIMVTDVLSTIPFLMKGIELIQSSRPKKKNVFAYVSGDENLGTMQLWSVQCMGQSKFRNIGIWFIFFGTFAITMGIGLEIWAGRYMRKKRINLGEHEVVKGPFGKPFPDFYTRFKRRPSN